MGSLTLTLTLTLTRGAPSSWEAVAPASGGYATLDYGDLDHPCYKREGCGTCVPPALSSASSW